MAFNAAAILIVRTGGSDNNSGGFNPANANFATDGAVSSATTSAPVFSTASYNFVAGDVGARVFIKSGTSSIPGWYTIASVASNQATLTASAGNATLFDGTNASGVSTATGCGTTGSLSTITWGVDYSNQDAAKIAYTDILASTTTFTSVANPVGKNIIGNYLNITSGTNFTVQRVEVVSTSTITATVDKTLGASAGAGGVGNLGGALASPGLAGGTVIAGNAVYIASGTYTVTSNSVNIAAGCFQWNSAGTATKVNLVEGFGTIPGDMGTPPVMSAGVVSNASLITSGGSGTYFVVRNVTANGNSQTTSTGISLAGAVGQIIDRCKALNCTTTGIGLAAAGLIYRCHVTGCSTTAFRLSTGAVVYYSEAYANSCAGFSQVTASTNTVLVGCISSANTGATTDGFSLTTTTYNVHMIGCVAYGNGRHGFNIAGPGILTNCIAEGHTAGAAYGFTTTTTANNGLLLVNCAAYNNTTGTIDTTKILKPAISFVTNTTGSFFTNAGSGDFSLNSTANQGTLARAAGYPGLMPRGTSTGYADIGAVQHQDAGGGGGTGGSYTFCG